MWVYRDVKIVLINGDLRTISGRRFVRTPITPLAVKGELQWIHVHPPKSAESPHGRIPALSRYNTRLLKRRAIA